MLPRFLAAVLVLAPIVACSAAAESEGSSESTASADTASHTCAFMLTEQNVKKWNGGSVAGVVVLVIEDYLGDANWAVVDLTSSAITEVLSVPASQKAAFQSVVVNASPGGRCDGRRDITGPVPCHPTGGGTCISYFEPDPGSVPDPGPTYPRPADAWTTDGSPTDCIFSEIVTTVAPTCVSNVQACTPVACDGACGTMSDGCTREQSCGGCGRGESCIANTCVNTHCSAGYRFCGGDGCVKGSVCP